MKKSTPLTARFLFTAVMIITVLSIVFNFYTNLDIPHLAIIGIVILEVVMVCTGIVLTIRHNKA